MLAQRQTIMIRGSINGEAVTDGSSKLPVSLEENKSREKNLRIMGAEEANIAEMLKHRSETTPNALAYRSKQNGLWVDTTWAQVYKQAKDIACGLLAQGLKLGDRVGLLSNTREEWALSDFGILLAGGVTVPLYPSNPPDICLHILQNSGTSFVIVENSQQLEKILSLQKQIPMLHTVILIEGTPPEGILSLSQLQEQGRSQKTLLSQELSKRYKHTRPHSLASIIYTSGTTGEPKGAMWTHQAFIRVTRYAMESFPALPDDVQLLFLPMAHIYGRLLCLYMVHTGALTVFAEGLENLGKNITEVHPTLLGAVPRVLEKVYSGFLHQVELGGWLKRSLVRWALKVGKQASLLRQNNQPLGLNLRWKYELADRLVFHRVRERLGGRLKWILSGAAPLSKEIMEFFHMCGMTVLEGYGMTETGITSNNHLDHFKFGTVGFSPHPDLQIKLAPDGEILVKGPTVFTGYYHLPKETRAAIDRDGWFHTGDVGSLDQDGFLSILDRKKDLIKTSAGKMIAPQSIERKLKLHPLVNQVVVVGDRHQYITVLFTINKEAAQEIIGGSLLSNEELANHPAVQKQLSEHLAAVNQILGHWEQIQYFRVLPNELTEAAGELTPSLKIKRKFVTEKYKSIIDEMYDDHVPHKEHMII